MPGTEFYAIHPSGPERLKLPEGAASLRAYRPQLSFGVYTTFRTFDHIKFLCLDVHLQRLDRSMELLGWRYRLDRQALRRALHRVCEAYPHPEARVRLDVLAEAAPALAGESRLLLTLFSFTPVPASFYKHGVAVSVAPRLARSLPEAKTADFEVARQSYVRGGADRYEHLLLDENGRILEGSTSNFYAVCDGGIWTAGHGVLEGVARKIVLDLIGELELPLRLEAPGLADLAAFDEAFMSSSSRGIVPIIAIAGEPIGSGEPGPITHRLMRAYARFAAESARPAIAGT